MNIKSVKLLIFSVFLQIQFAIMTIRKFCAPEKMKMCIRDSYNGHAHSPMGLMRGYGENLALMDWLNTRIFPFEDKLTGNAVYWGTMMCMAESIRYGIISSSDMYYFIPDMVKAVADSGAKANLSRAVANPMGCLLYTSFLYCWVYRQGTGCQNVY